MQSGYQIRNQNGIYFITFAVVEWVDVFTRKEYADLVVESLQYCQKQKGLLLYGWCLMSNHLHLIASAQEGSALSDIIRDFKKFTSSSILKAIEQNTQESRRNWMLWIFRTAGEKNGKNTRHQFWRHDNHPIELLTNKFKDEKLHYLHQNPVTAGLVAEAEHYLYSSAIDYAGGKGLLTVVFL
ncbi:REP-associated tyrosine transposase [Pontibacter beigongshangensis]|uniref:REP-associated tyrosine transposase n=1 Tax=Pontibacter beigongshangensis TaxID=2574733 RepID=UPI001650BF6B|nr:transposase [Pontibacter beigongshangensis]